MDLYLVVEWSWYLLTKDLSYSVECNLLCKLFAEMVSVCESGVIGAQCLGIQRQVCVNLYFLYLYYL